MDPKLAAIDNAPGIKSFLLAKRKELDLCNQLLCVKHAAKKMKEEDFKENERLLKSANDEMKRCIWFYNKYNEHCKQPGSKASQMYLRRSEENARNLCKIIEDLKKLTYFFGGKKMFEEDILKDLDKATKEFLKNAD